MKNVMIKLKCAQGIGEEKEEIEFFTEGTLEATDNGYILSYVDDSLVAGAHIETVLTLSGKHRVELERSGALTSKLTFEKGVRSSCFYSVPEGSLTLGIYGKEIISRLGDNGGRIKMVYTVDSDMRLISENSIEINVFER